MPDAAQVTIPEAYARPDFIYRRPSENVAIFIDGHFHDAAAVAERDASAEKRLTDQGWNVIRFRYDDDWTQIVGDNPTTFGNGR